MVRCHWKEMQFGRFAWASLLCTFCSVSVHGFPTSEPGENWTLTLRISFCHQLTAWVCCSLVYIVCVPITPLCGRPFQFQILLPLMWVVLSCCPVTVYNLLVVHLQVASEIWDPLDTLLHICRGPALFLPLVQPSPFHKSLIILFWSYFFLWDPWRKGLFLPSYWIPGLIFQGVLLGIQVLYTLVLVVLQYHPF